MKVYRVRGERQDAVNTTLGLRVSNWVLCTVLHPSTPEEFGSVSDLIRRSTLVLVTNPISWLV